MTDTKSKFFWYELMTSDHDAAIEFYTKVVGWNADQVVTTPDGGRYTILAAGDRGIGAVPPASRIDFTLASTSATWI